MWQVKSLTFCLAHLFLVKPQVCNAGANCSNPNLILCKIAFVSLVTVDIVNSISRTVVNIIVLCKGPSGLVTKLNKKKKKKKSSDHFKDLHKPRLLTKFYNNPTSPVKVVPK